MRGLRVLNIMLPAAVLSLSVLMVGCRSSSKVVADSDRERHAVLVSKTRKGSEKIAKEAMTWMGTPYAYAKADKGVGTDCSGMVMEVYQKATGHKLPRNSAKQAEFCLPLKEDQVAVGDLVFFATGKDPKQISHVGIMLGGDEFIHASSKKGVVISKVSSPYYTRTLMMYGRVPDTSDVASIE